MVGGWMFKSGYTRNPSDEIPSNTMEPLADIGVGNINGQSNAKHIRNPAGESV